MRSHFAFCGFIILSVLSCSPKADPDYLPVEFSVNADVLGESFSYSLLSFSLNYPRDVQPVDSAAFLNFQESVKADTNGYFKIELLDMKQSTQGTAVTISKIDSNEILTKILNDNYLEQLKATFDTQAIIRNTVSINNIPTVQFIVTSKDYIIIKLFLLFEPNFIQVDYFIPSHQYYELLDQIESSMGSISHKSKEERK